MAQPLILYVPGLLPKPEPALHREALQRCLLTAVRRLDADVADDIEATSGAFDLVAWTYDFYLEHRDFEIDRAAVDAVIEQAAPAARDVVEARAWQRRLTRWVYRLGDRLPFLIPHVASERMEVHLRDLRRYIEDDNGIAGHTRRMLKLPLIAAAEGGHPLLLIGHSMGSVIAWDTLWQLSHEDGDVATVDTLLTLGSPLGQRYIRRRLLGAWHRGAERYPWNVRHWLNLAAYGDLTALDVRLQDNFREMLSFGLVESIVDKRVRNWFRLDGQLNVHSEYGYLVNPVTAKAVTEWWRQARG